MLKRLIACLCCLTLLLTALPAMAREEEEEDPAEAVVISAEQLAEAEELDKIDEDEPVYVVGEVYHEMTIKEANKNTPAIYRASVKKNSSLFSERDITSPRVTRLGNNATVEVLFVGPTWCLARWNGKIGYIKRQQFEDRAVTALDPVNTPPYGVLKSAYIATTATECHVRKSMSEQDADWIVLNPGTAVSIWKVMNGWGIVIFKRNYGYINMNELTNLIPVSPTDTPLRADTPIAAYTSYYNMAQTETNQSRIINISVACQRLTRVMQTGEDLNFNKQVGPYKKAIGYQPAPVLSNGVTTVGFGGGTCQVSSTLYNALMQLPGITILQRRPHGPSAASYLPHGMDAAVGNSALNLRFRNDYPFPIRVEGHTSNDGALTMIIYRADTMTAASN